ncbi:hypothetical protein VKT23_015589 [Stygiomarasmius scandens]|uniref:Uncharacterized protein n=1 Tax=Marasmiellus scandens TaxID=2682957 RepID=A0ABR1IXN7_9AGAR
MGNFTFNQPTPPFSNESTKFNMTRQSSTQPTVRATRSRTKDSDLYPPLNAEPPRPRRAGGKKTTNRSELQNTIESEHPHPDPEPSASSVVPNAASEGNDDLDAPVLVTATAINTPRESNTIARSPTPHPSLDPPPDVEPDTLLPDQFENLEMLDVSMADLDAEAEEIASQKRTSDAPSFAEPVDDEPEQQALDEPYFTEDHALKDSSDSPPSPTTQHYQSRLLQALEKQGIVHNDTSGKHRHHPSKSQSRIPPLSLMRSLITDPPTNNTVVQETEPLQPRPPFPPAADCAEESNDESEWGGCVPDPPSGTGTLQQSVTTAAPPPPLSTSQAEQAVTALREYSASPSMSIPAISSRLETILQAHFTQKWRDAINAATPQDPDDSQCQRRLEMLIPSLVCPQRIKKSVNYAPMSTDPNDPLVDYASDGSSDYGADQEAEQKKRMAKLRRTKKIRAKERQGSHESSASDEADNEDDSENENEDEDEDEDKDKDEEEDPALVARRMRPGKERKKANKKVSFTVPKAQANGKGQATTTITTNEKGKKVQNGSPSASIGDDEDEDDDSPTGRVPTAMRAEVLRLRAQYESKMQDIASRFKQSVHHAYQIAGEVTLASRDPNLFNIFEKWWVAETGHNGQLPKDVNPGTFFSEKWRDHRKETLGEAWNDSKKVEEEYTWLRAWFSERYSSDPKMMRGPTKADVKKVAGVVSDVAKQAMLNRGVLVFSFVIDPLGEHSMIAGWGKEFKALKTEHPTQITRQLQDVTTLVRHERINAEIGAAVSDELQNLALKASEVGTDREREQALVPQILLYDIGTLGIKAKKFKWKSFANYAYRNQICIKNWPEGIPAPGSGLTRVNHAVPKAGGPSQLTLARIQELTLLREGWARKEENPSIPDHIQKLALRVVSWSDKDKALPPDQQKDVVLVTCVDGHTLTSVLHSTDWRSEQGQDDTEVGISTSTKTNAQSKQKSKQKSKVNLKSKTPVASEQNPTTPSPPASPPHLEFEPPQYWQDYCFSEAEDDNLRREPDPSPFSSPVRPDRGVPNLFLAAQSQSRHLASSPTEHDDIERASMQPAYNGGYQSSQLTSIPRLPIRSQPRQVSNNAPRERERTPMAGPSRLALEQPCQVPNNPPCEHGRERAPGPSRLSREDVDISPRPVMGNPVPKRPRDDREATMRPQKRSKTHQNNGRPMTTAEKWRRKRVRGEARETDLASKEG